MQLNISIADKRPIADINRLIQKEIPVKDTPWDSYYQNNRTEMTSNIM
jgi:hypothetical protein